MLSSHLNLQRQTLSVFEDESDYDSQAERQKILELIPQENDKDTTTTIDAAASAQSCSRPIRHHNLFFYKRLHVFSSLFVLLMTISVIYLYLFSNFFDEYKRTREDFCSNAEQSFAGYEECKDRCSDYRCCFTTGYESCMDSNKISCRQFESCTILDRIASQSSNHSKYLTSVCSEDSLLGSNRNFVEYEDPLEQCAIACAEVECCFLEGDRSCRDGFEEYCDMYRSCLNIYNIMGAIEKGPGPVILDKDTNDSTEMLDGDKNNV